MNRIPKITRLKVYIAHVTQLLASSTSLPKRDFFEREIRKSQAEIDRLTK